MISCLKNLKVGDKIVVALSGNNILFKYQIDMGAVQLITLPIVRILKYTFTVGSNYAFNYFFWINNPSHPYFFERNFYLDNSYIISIIKK